MLWCTKENPLISVERASTLLSSLGLGTFENFVHMDFEEMRPFVMRHVNTAGEFGVIKSAHHHFKTLSDPVAQVNACAAEVHDAAVDAVFEQGYYSEAAIRELHSLAV